MKLTDRRSIIGVLKEMTIDEKIAMLSAATACQTVEIPRLGIPAIRLVDGATGVNSTEIVVDYINGHPDKADTMDWGKAMEVAAAPWDYVEEKYRNDEAIKEFVDFMGTYRTHKKDFLCFPSGVNIGATWNPTIARQCGEDTGWELRDSNIDVCLGPNVDVQRDPLGGRNYEMYGEDPYLVGEIATAYIAGMQSTGVGACAKHFMANNQETQREIKVNHVSERTLKEIYSNGFMKAVQKADVKAIMSAYSSLNGIFCSYNKTILTDWLKNEWGFSGMVVSDWGAANKDKPSAIAAGLDLVLPGPNNMADCMEAIKSGRISEEIVDDHVSRILGVICDLKQKQASVAAVYDMAEMRLHMRELICDGSVLLRNRDVLPLDINEISKDKMVIWGAAAVKMLECGLGSTNVVTGLHGDFYQEMRSRIGKENVTYETWSEGKYFIYLATAQGGEGSDRKAMTLDKIDEEQIPVLLKEAKQRNMKTVVVLNVSGPVEFQAWERYADAILCIFIPGLEGAGAVADMIIGEAEPGGRLPVTFPVRYEDSPCYPNFPGEYKDAFYGEGIFVGYRSYEKRKLRPQYAFGFGLGYTVFEQKTNISSLKWDLEKQDTVSIPVSVKNIGRRRGSQVIQLYVGEEQPHLLRPIKELKAFQKVSLEAGEEKTIVLEIKKEDMSCFDDQMSKWVLPVGCFTIYLGTSSEDIFDKIELRVTGNNPYKMNADTLFSDILANPATCEILNKYFPGMTANEGIAILGDRKLKDAMSTLIISFVPDAVKGDEILKKVYQEIEAVSS